MAEITVDAAAQDVMYLRGGPWGPFWTSPSVGYIVFCDADGDAAVTKTTDSGATWAEQDASNRIQCGSFVTAMLGAWFDKNTAGDTGTKIHVGHYSVDVTTGHKVQYAYFDTSTDTWGTPVSLDTNAGTTDGNKRLSITKSRGGVLFCTYFSTGIFNTMKRSTDGTTWNARTDPIEVIGDLAHLYPANLSDNNDIWCLYADVSADEVSLKTYDDSGDSWSEASIATTIADSTTHPFAVMKGAVRHSDGHLLVGIWTEFDTATADLLTFDITDAGTITAKTNVSSNVDDIGYVALFINQQNNDVYVAYFGDEAGGDALGSLVPVNYRLSTDDMGTWGSEVTYFATEDDYRGIDAGMGVGNQGGRFMPVFFDDDDQDLFVDDANDVEIAAAAVADSSKYWRRTGNVPGMRPDKGHTPMFGRTW